LIGPCPPADPILQSHLPHTPWAEPAMRRLPGIQPLEMADWLVVDDAYAGQMAARDRLIATRPAEVHALTEGARAAAGELLDMVLALLAGRGDFAVGGDAVTRPDGVRVPLDRAAPLLMLGRLVQEDFGLLQPGGGRAVGADRGDPVLSGQLDAGGEARPPAGADPRPGAAAL